MNTKKVDFQVDLGWKRDIFERRNRVCGILAKQVIPQQVRQTGQE